MQYGGQHSCFIFWWELQVTWPNKLIMGGYDSHTLYPRRMDAKNVQRINF